MPLTRRWRSRLPRTLQFYQLPLLFPILIRLLMVFLNLGTCLYQKCFLWVFPLMDSQHLMNGNNVSLMSFTLFKVVFSCLETIGVTLRSLVSFGWDHRAIFLRGTA